MILSHRSKNRSFFIIIASLFLIAGAAMAIIPLLSQKEKACTMEAKLCPDGSSVGRIGPDCEFAECSKIIIDSSWKKFTDPDSGASIRYPETIPEKYISVIDWPPKISVTDEVFSCLEAGSETTRAGKTELHMIGNRSYCVTKVSEGAAGSIFTSYAYATPILGKNVILTFTLRGVQCGNYDEPKTTECQKERESFDIGGLINQIVGSLEMRSDSA
jgi:hypothetical protein